MDGRAKASDALYRNVPARGRQIVLHADVTANSASTDPDSHVQRRARQIDFRPGMGSAGGIGEWVVEIAADPSKILELPDQRSPEV